MLILRNIGLKTYEDIEKHLEVETRNKKEDKRSNNNHNNLFENISLGGKITKFLRGSNINNEDKNVNESYNEITEYEKKFIKELKIKKSEYKEIKKTLVNDISFENKSKKYL